MMAGLSFGGIGGALELRAAATGETHLSGSFPYLSLAVISDGGRNGRPQKEEFAPHAFEHRVNDPQAEIYLLAGHRFDKPLASKQAGTLVLQDTPQALRFEAVVTPDVGRTSFAADVLALLVARLATGISPGFRIPPARAVPADDAEEFYDEPNDPANGQFQARIRRIKQALLYELSIVTQPAYPDAQVAANPTVTRAAQQIVRPTRAEIFRRWRH